jgi:uncharacterized membrane protein YphA (DoxX/SURF4 family)
MTASSSDHRGPLGVKLAPLFLRAALAVTFIWAGLGKVIPKMTVDPAQAAILSSMGVHIAASSSTPAQPADHPTQPLPPTDDAAPPTPDSTVAPTPAERAANPNPADAAPAQPSAPAPSVPPAATQQVPEIKVARVYGLALRLHSAANPPPDEAGKPQMRLWPSFLGNGNWPRYFAWAVAIAELVGGFLVAVGLLTRLGAFLLVGVMLGAIWLDQIGPAIQAGQTALLILPAHDTWDIAAWRPLLWQFTLLCCASALMLIGAGAPSLDRALGWGQRRRDDDEL